MKRLWIIYLVFLPVLAQAKDSIQIRGQLSGIASYSPENRMDLFIGGRYIPELNYEVTLDSFRSFDFNAAAYTSGSVLFHPGDTAAYTTVISPYRLWGRYTNKRLEVRVGLQKIDFGSAALIRPLQWFNRIDPRDPLQLTNGVYGVLGRYYFLNNANIWLWSLYGNEDPRGFDLLGSNTDIPEFGGRVQVPVPSGELAFSYNHRTASSIGNQFLPEIEQIPEDKFGLDGKFDLIAGVWFEASYSKKNKDLGSFTHQTMINLGSDYTFGLGNGIHIMAEHLIAAFDQEAFAFQNPVQVSALTMSYPLSFFDNVSAIFYQSWLGNDFTFFVNYEHQFRWFSSYVMLYYNPSTQQGIQQNELVNNFSGPGCRIMLVYNH